MNERDREFIARQIYAGWAKNKNVPAWHELQECRKEQWRWAAESAYKAMTYLTRNETAKAA